MKDEAQADQFYIDVILSRHARKLLSSYRLRDLAFFAANLEDYQLVSWLRKERSVMICILVKGDCVVMYLFH